MNTQVLIDSIVRQTTVLIAQLATAGGLRAPLSHIANQVFLDLTRALKDQGVSRKVSADMFGMAFRAYLRKIQRLSESTTEHGRSLWEAVYAHVQAHPMIRRADLLERFARDEPTLVRGVIRDLTESGLVFAAGSGPETVFRASSETELAHLRQQSESGLDELLWVLIYRQGPIGRSDLVGVDGANEEAIEAALARLQASGRVSTNEFGALVSHEFFVPRDAERGFEAAVFDHYQALVKTICARLSPDDELSLPAGAVGGSTYTFDVWPEHPHYEEVLGLLEQYRQAYSTLRERVETYNRRERVPDRFVQVVAYAGQCALLRDHDNEGENDDAN